MEFSEKYTTQEKISLDKDGIEEKKTILSNDAFAVGEALSYLTKIMRLKR